jgi:hypothetical protein
VPIYSVFHEERSIFWEVIISVILSKKVYILFGKVSEIELFHCTVPKLFIRKRYYVLFLIPVFIVQVTKLVQFTQHNTVANLPHARTVEPQKKPLLSNTRTQQQNNGVMKPVSRQQLGKHVPTRNNGNCVSVDECYSSLLGSSQRVNELAG